MNQIFKLNNKTIMENEYLFSKIFYQVDYTFCYEIYHLLIQNFVS